MEELAADSTNEQPDTVSPAGWGTAAQHALAKGLPVTISHDGRELRVYPDGRVEDIGPAMRETTAQLAARFEMGRSDFARVDVSDLSVPPALREIAKTISVLADQGIEIVDSVAAQVPETPVWTVEKTAGNDSESGASAPTAERVDVAPANAEDPAADDRAAAATAEYNLKMMAVACANARTMLEFTSELMQVKTFADMVELSATYTRRQIEAGTEQAKTLSAAAEKIKAKKSAAGG